MEVYQRISTVLLRTVAQQEISQEEAFRLGMMDLFNTAAFHDWEQAFSRLESVAENLVRLQQKNRVVMDGDLVTRIKRYIDAHLEEGPSLTELSDHFHFSREYLLRVFKKEEGVTILQYINDLKLELAKNMLKKQGRAVKDVASALGFSSTAYFIRFFRTKTGMSPQSYKSVSST